LLRPAGRREHREQLRALLPAPLSFARAPSDLPPSPCVFARLTLSVAGGDTMLRLIPCVVVPILAVSASAQMRITEVQYKDSEYIEFTNVGTTPVDMTGWSYDDDSRLAGRVSLTAFGVLAPGASAILCESSASAFA